MNEDLNISTATGAAITFNIPSGVDYTESLEAIVVGVQNQNVLMESLLSGSTEQWELAAETYAELQVRYDTLLESTAKQEKQLEACISILLIFIVVGVLNFIYKFFKIFF